MSNFLLRYCLSFLIVMLTGAVPLAALAADSVPVPAPFPQSVLQSTTNISSPGHLVLFSPVREVNNSIRSETMARLPVTGEGYLYEIDRDSSREKAREYYLGQLQDAGAQILYTCSGIECGRSNVWANRIFGQRVLYGPDTTQDYMVAVAEAGDGSRWLTLVYTVTRGNRREYLWLEHLKVEEGAVIPGFGAATRVLGPVVVSWQGGITYQFDWTASDRRKIREWAEDDDATIVVTGFSQLQETETLEQSMERAEKAAESLSEVLEKTGVSRSKQKLVVVGPTVFFGDPERQGDRVELTVIRGPL